MLSFVQKSHGNSEDRILMRPSFNQKYQVQKVLGEGSSATVHCLLEKDTERLLALKQYKSNKNWPGAVREAGVLSTLHHPHVIRFEKLIRTDQAVQFTHLGRTTPLCSHSLTLQLVTEYFDGQTLSQFISKHNSPNNPLSEGTIRKILVQLCAALEHCHSQSVAHLDLKLDNVLVSSQLQIKLIDFAFSVKFNPAAPQHTVYCGTPNYMAPEVLSALPFSPVKADVWALGVLAYKLASGGGSSNNNKPHQNSWLRLGNLCQLHDGSPFRGLDSQGVLQRIREEGSIDQALSKLGQRGYSAGFCRFVSRMLKIDPASRDSMSQLCQDDWLKVNENSPPEPTTN